MPVTAITRAKAPTGWLLLEDVAAAAGITYKSARTLHGRATRNRAAGKPRPQDMPAPSKVYGRTPVWKPDVIRAWVEYRDARPANELHRPKSDAL